jgi:hypothetical protein
VFQRFQTKPKKDEAHVTSVSKSKLNCASMAGREEACEGVFESWLVENKCSFFGDIVTLWQIGAIKYLIICVFSLCLAIDEFLN